VDVRRDHRPPPPTHQAGDAAAGVRQRQIDDRIAAGKARDLLERRARVREVLDDIGQHHGVERPRLQSGV
jgi:hypothetical protein